MNSFLALYVLSNLLSDNSVRMMLTRSRSLNSRDRLREKVTKAGVQLNRVAHGRSYQQSLSASGTPKVCSFTHYGNWRTAGLISQDRKSSALMGGVAVQVETITEYSSYHPRQVSTPALSWRVTF